MKSNERKTKYKIELNRNETSLFFSLQGTTKLAKGITN